MTKITGNKLKSYSIINFHQKLINMLYIILILISFSTYCIFPIKVFGLEPTSGIVCHELNKKQKTDFLFKRNDDKIFAKVFKRINGNFEYVGKDFSKKVREIYYDKENKKTIYGITSPEERKELKEEGIDLLSIPWLDKDN